MLSAWAKQVVVLQEIVMLQIRKDMRNWRLDSCNLDANFEETVINFVLCFPTIQVVFVLCFWPTPIKLVP